MYKNTYIINNNIVLNNPITIQLYFSLQHTWINTQTKGTNNYGK
jgi:hypothetical protein